MPAIIDKTADALHSKKADTSSASNNSTFDNKDVTVIFVLGGPGAGKGTQCEKLVAEFGFCHLSAGDLLRDEQKREGSEYAELIRTYIKEGTVVPMEITIKLLENAMKSALQEGRSREGWGAGKGRFLVDGFPRKMDQALKFDEDVCLSALVLFFSTTEEVLQSRLLERGKTSGREDDNAESIKKRFVTYNETTMPVVNYYKKEGKVAEVDSSPPIDEVYVKTAQIVRNLFSGNLSGNVAV